MSKCDHTWVMDDSPRPACHKCFMERDACAMSERIATLERELSAARRVLDDAKALIEQKDVIIGVKRLEATRAEEALAAVTAERDAYRDQMYAGPWQPVADHHNGEGYSRAGAAFVGRRRDGAFDWSSRSQAHGKTDTADEAKAAADAHLLASGWYLAPAPPTGTPGDGTR